MGKQGMQLVKGAWARILVGKDKTRAALHGAKEKAGAGKGVITNGLWSNSAVVPVQAYRAML